MVQNLQILYTVIIGLSLFQAVSNVIDVTRGAVPIKVELIPFFISFVVTLLPLYHAAMRHLDDAQQGQAKKRIRGGALLTDFFLIGIEGCLFVALGVLVLTPEFFVWVLAGLFGLNSVRAFGALFFAPRDVRSGAELRWALLNLATAEILIIYFTWIGPLPPTAGLGEPALAAAILVITLVRTVADYAFCWNFLLSEGVKLEARVLQLMPHDR